MPAVKVPKMLLVVENAVARSTGAAIVTSPKISVQLQRNGHAKKECGTSYLGPTKGPAKDPAKGVNPEGPSQKGPGRPARRAQAAQPEGPRPPSQ